MKTTLNIIDVAKTVIVYGNTKGYTINHLKLQKLLYYIQAWNFAINDFNLYNDNELPEAWINGPVYRTVYNDYMKFQLYEDLRIENLDLENAIEEIPLEVRDSKYLELIYEVLDKYGTFSADELVFITHNERPWLEARAGLSPLESSRKLISESTIKEYYTAVLTKANSNNE